jgi:hypothetical protein
VVDLAARRASRSRPAFGGAARPWALLAAGVAAGVLVVSLFTNRSPGLYSTHGRELVAQGGLAQALDRNLASAPESAAPIRVGLSFKARDGRYCRTFTVAASSLAGLACREGLAWDIRAAVFTRSASTEGAYRTAAASTPAPIVAAVQDLIEGSPLDAKGEAEAKARGWR